MGKVFGIDLGTTYSCIAHIDENGKPVVLKNAEGDLTTPSVVYFETQNDITVGSAAKAGTANMENNMTNARTKETLRIEITPFLA